MRLTIFILTSFIAFNVLAAGDPVAGEAKSKICAACHGMKGISPNDLWPNLAGQKEGYLIKQIKAFQAEERIDASMLPMVKPLTPQDIEDIAAYYARLK